jgi:hypothetical protein
MPSSFFCSSRLKYLFSILNSNKILLKSGLTDVNYSMMLISYWGLKGGLGESPKWAAGCYSSTVCLM